MAFMTPRPWRQEKSLQTVSGPRARTIRGHEGRRRPQQMYVQQGHTTHKSIYRIPHFVPRSVPCSIPGPGEPLSPFHLPQRQIYHSPHPHSTFRPMFHTLSGGTPLPFVPSLKKIIYHIPHPHSVPCSVPGPAGPLSPSPLPRRPPPAASSPAPPRTRSGARAGGPCRPTCEPSERCCRSCRDTRDINRKA